MAKHPEITITFKFCFWVRPLLWVYGVLDKITRPMGFDMYVDPVTFSRKKKTVIWVVFVRVFWQRKKTGEPIYYDGKPV